MINVFVLNGKRIKAVNQATKVEGITYFSLDFIFKAKGCYIILENRVIQDMLWSFAEMVNGYLKL